MKYKKMQTILFMVLYCSLEFAALQLFLDANPFDVGLQHFLKNICLLMAGNGILLCLFHRMRPAMLLSGIVILIIGVANYCMYQIRGYGIVFMDFYAVSTAATVAGQYTVGVEPCLFAGLAVGLLPLVAACLLLPQKKEAYFQKRTVLVSLAGLFVCGGFFVWLHSSDLFWDGVSDVYWDNQIGFREQGYCLYFTANAGRPAVSEPEGYSAQRAQSILDAYMPEETEGYRFPNLILIMNESFADLRVLGDFQTNGDVTPFWDSLTENTVKGYADTSVYGGYTANSEFEFLTGCTKAFLPGSPYLQTIYGEIPALPRTLKSTGAYEKVTAFHPYYPSGYRRGQVYPLLGFDAFLSLEDMQQADTLRGYVTDAADYEELIELFENQHTPSPFAAFNVTIQNHGPYSRKQKTTHPVKITSFSAGKDVNCFLSLMRESDEALKNLISYFETVEEPAVVAVFGDHQPRLPDDFYAQLTGKAPVQFTAEETRSKYRVPFMIWANYDIPEKTVEHISLNYLSTELAGDVGLPMCAYQRFLAQMQREIPSICEGGYYDRDGEFHGFHAVGDSEKKRIEQYKIVQYYTLFEKKRRDKYYEIILR